MKPAYSSIQFFFLSLVVLISTETHGDQEKRDSCYSTQDVTVSYSLWIGTQVNESRSITVTVKQYTTFYDEMKIAEIRDQQQYT